MNFSFIFHFHLDQRSVYTCMLNLWYRFKCNYIEKQHSGIEPHHAATA